eukprot:TRINITY_DN10173_c0_g3_i1.p1 TRINITY_DN10173_c0_g3~~TRINITY_DN10173_c0_g3_i1.p1  ORF type:complete len:169 (+),score=20.98 TRINITY_DN10173_c0_g3_i1:3-509(+)
MRLRVGTLLHRIATQHPSGQYSRTVHHSAPSAGDYVSDTDFSAVLNRLFEAAQARSRGTPPASRNALETLLKEVTVSQDQVDRGEQCVVCRMELTLRDTCTALPCTHAFHPDCIKPWLSLHNTCPCCRYELPTEDANYEREHGRPPPQQSQPQPAPQPPEGPSYMDVS